MKKNDTAHNPHNNLYYIIFEDFTKNKLPEEKAQKLLKKLKTLIDGNNNKH